MLHVNIHWLIFLDMSNAGLGLAQQIYSKAQKAVHLAKVRKCRLHVELLKIYS